jgi:hypothetical protein
VRIVPTYLIQLDTISDTCDDFFHNGAMVAMLFVVPETHETPTMGDGVDVAFHNAVIELLAMSFPAGR